MLSDEIQSSKETFSKDEITPKWVETWKAWYIYESQCSTHRHNNKLWSDISCASLK